MIKLKVHNPPKIKLKTSGYMGQPEGNIDLPENNTQYNVAAFATATTAIPEEIKHAVPSTVQQDVIPDEGLLKKVIVEPAPLDEITITPSTIEQNIAPTSPAIGFSGVTVKGYIPPAEPEWKYVNFIDYDGTLLYSYTKEEIAEATSLPPAPTHEGLTFQEWNWDLQDVKDNGTPLVVGATYNTDDGATRIYFEYEDNLELNADLEFSRGNNANTTIDIDWGDGTTETINLNTSSVNTSHIYNTPNKYMISILPQSQISSIGSPSTSKINTYIEKIFIGSNIQRLSTYSLYYASLLSYVIFPTTNFTIDTVSVRPSQAQTIIIPKKTTISASQLRSSNSLQILSTPKELLEGYRSPDTRTQLSKFNLPKGLTSIAVYSLSSLKRKQEIYFPEGVTELLTGVAYQSDGIIKVVFPKSLEFIGGNAFFQCINLSIIDCYAFDDPNSIPQIETTSFAQAPVSSILVKNSEMLTAFSTATNWSTYADRFQIK